MPVVANVQPGSVRVAPVIVDQPRHVFIDRSFSFHRHTAVTDAASVSRDAALGIEKFVGYHSVLMAPEPEHWFLDEARKLLCHARISRVLERRPRLMVAQQDDPLIAACKCAEGSC